MGALPKIKPKKVKSVLLLGPPGQGKTTSFKAAAEKVAAGLGLEFVLNPDDDFVATKDHFMFVSHECSGENLQLVLLVYLMRKRSFLMMARKLSI